MRVLAGLFAGLVFGVGLVVSGMSNPAKVLNFLDFAGSFDPSLAFVLGGAVVTAFLGYRLIGRRERPLLAESFDRPSTTEIDAPLILGAALFGVGWGIGGYCPGPAWTGLGLAAPGTLVFIAAMLLGIALTHLVRGRAGPSPRTAEQAR